MAEEKQQFEVKLFQSHIARSHTETFTFEATDEEDARKQAEALVAEKEITDDYDFEIASKTQAPVNTEEDTNDVSNAN